MLALIEMILLIGEMVDGAVASVRGLYRFLEKRESPEWWRFWDRVGRRRRGSEPSPTPE